MTWWQSLLIYFRSCAKVEWEVWDRPTRFFHWAMTGVLVAALFTGWADPPWQLDRHLLFGGTATGLLLFRLLWGLVGPEYSRFSRLLFSPARFWQDVHNLWQGHVQPSMGLNPANAWLSLLLLAVVAGLAVSGFMVYGGEEHLGPLASLVSFELGNSAAMVHENLCYGLLLLLVAHVLVIGRESQVTDVSLLRSMITGCKPVWAQREGEVRRPLDTTWVAVMAVLLMLGVDHLSKSLGQLPMDGWRPLHYPQAYQDKCGTCHWTLHPSLLPEEAWQEVLLHLDHHFGSKVALSAKEAVVITSFVMVHAAEDWDTEAAHRFRKAPVSDSGRMVNNPVWHKIHINLPSSLLESPPVFSAINCPVCHHDALSGRFDEHAIHVPRGAK